MTPTDLIKQIEGHRREFLRKIKKHEEDHDYSKTASGERIYLGGSATTANIFAEIHEDYQRTVAPLRASLIITC